jgi:hypothetical protein
VAFPEFGLYIFRHGPSLIAFRCKGAPPKGAPRGHRHDDNLAIEYRLGAHERRDPGSCVYTPSVETRNRYRAAAAHDVPRLRGVALADLGGGLFDLHEVAYAQCLCWRPEGVAGEVRGAFGSILRIVGVTEDALEIYDCVTGGLLDDVARPLPVAPGYGRA